MYTNSPWSPHARGAMFHGGATFKSPRSRDPGSILPSGAVWVEFARSPLRPHGFPPALQRLAGPQFNCPTPVPSPLHRLQQGSPCVSCSGLRLYRRWDPPPLCYQRGCPTKWEGNIPPQDRTRSPRESDAAITIPSTQRCCRCRRDTPAFCVLSSM